jgi:phage gp46-like protein
MDIALVFQPGTFIADIDLEAGDLKADEDLLTALTLSLFCDRRSNPDDPLEEGESRRGYWGDTFPEVQKDKYGSRLWLLRREKQLPIVLQRAREYAIEATQWLLEDRVASSVRIETEIVGQKQSGILGIKVEVVRPQGFSTFNFKYQYVWEQI